MYVEACIEDRRHPPPLTGLPEQLGIGRPLVVGYELRPAGPIDAGHSGEASSKGLRQLIRHRHRAIAGTGPIRNHARPLALEHARAERLIPDSPLQHEVQSIAQLRPIGPRQHAAVAERSWTVLHPALKPHHDLTFGK